MQFFVFFILLGLFLSCSPDSKSISAYGEKVRFSRNAQVKFEDFTLTYLGEKPVPSTVQAVFFHHFEAHSKTEKTQIVFTDSKDRISPIDFQINEKIFEIEFGMSEMRGKLAPDELIIRKK